MSGALGEALAAGLLAAVVGSAVVQSGRVPESAVALGAALVLVATGVISWDAAWDEAGDLAPTLGFLSAMLVLADLCEFVRLGAMTVPPALILATVLLWLGVKVIGT